MAQQRAIFGGGCFWCTEAVFRQVKGVSQVISGYAGGARPNPSYEQVCSGATGHAEVIAVDFDDSIISFETCLLYTSPSPRDLSTSRMPSSA